MRVAVSPLFGMVNQQFCFEQSFSVCLFVFPSLSCCFRRLSKTLQEPLACDRPTWSVYALCCEKAIQTSFAILQKFSSVCITRKATKRLKRRLWGSPNEVRARRSILRQYQLALHRLLGRPVKDLAGREWLQGLRLLLASSELIKRKVHSLYRKNV